MYNFCFDITKSLTKELRRVIAEQVDLALSILNNEDIGIGKSVHETRRAIKKIKAVLLLFEGNAAGFKVDKNYKYLGGIAKSISEIRDIDVFIETIKKIHTKSGGIISSTHYDLVKKELVRIKDKLLKDKTSDNVDIVKETIEKLEEFKLKIPNIKLDNKSYKIILKHIRKTYTKGRHLLKLSKNDLDSEIMHKFRKQAKYLWYQLSLMSNIWPQMITVYCASLKELSDIIGYEHDIFELSKFMFDRTQIDNGIKEDINSILSKKRLMYKKEFIPLADKIYSLKPKQFYNNLLQYYKVVSS